MSFQTDLMAEARRYVAQTFRVDTNLVPDDTNKLRDFIESSYPGGFEEFATSYRRHVAAQNTTAEPYSPIKMKAIVEAHCHVRLSEYDHILLFHVSENEMRFVLSRANVDRRARRDLIRERTIELYRFQRPDASHSWPRHPDYVSTTEECNEVHLRFGIVNDASREAAKREQAETCYRPGTAKSPMQGWVARLELSWAQAHEGESFPITTDQ